MMVMKVEVAETTKGQGLAIAELDAKFQRFCCVVADRDRLRGHRLCFNKLGFLPIAVKLDYLSW
jgi:hypothetical protein